MTPPRIPSRVRPKRGEKGSLTFRGPLNPRPAGAADARVIAKEHGRTPADDAQEIRPSTSLGIIPATLDRGEARPAEDFWIFDNEQVAVELISGHLTITQPREVAMHAQMFARLAEIAVYGERARELIAALTPVT